MNNKTTINNTTINNDEIQGFLAVDYDSWDQHRETTIHRHNLGQVVEIGRWAPPSFGSGGGFSRLSKSSSVEKTDEGFVAVEPGWLYLVEGDTIGADRSGRARVFTRVLHLWEDEESIVEEAIVEEDSDGVDDDDDDDNFNPFFYPGLSAEDLEGEDDIDDEDEDDDLGWYEGLSPEVLEQMLQNPKLKD